MPFSVRIENLDAIFRERVRLGRLRDGGAKVVARAVSTLKRRLVPFAKRDIGAEYNLPSREIGKRLRARGDESSVTLTGIGRPQTLIKFGARQNASGVAVQVRRGKALQIAHAFIRVPAGAPGAGQQVFIRIDIPSSLPDDVEGGDISYGDGKGWKYQSAKLSSSVHGYPIMLLMGPGVADMLRDDARAKRIDDFAQKTFAAEVDRLLELARG